eukprot:13489818-Ditylum_brightwellii.AAC.1
MKDMRKVELATDLTDKYGSYIYTWEKAEAKCQCSQQFSFLASLFCSLRTPHSTVLPPPPAPHSLTVGGW